MDIEEDNQYLVSTNQRKKLSIKLILLITFLILAVIIISVTLILYFKREDVKFFFISIYQKGNKNKSLEIEMVFKNVQLIN
jgi:cell division protein FtsL